jgi:hypothetical protein
VPILPLRQVGATLAPSGTPLPTAGLSLAGCACLLTCLGRPVSAIGSAVFLAATGKLPGNSTTATAFAYRPARKAIASKARGVRCVAPRPELRKTFIGYQLKLFSKEPEKIFVLHGEGENQKPAVQG